MSDRSSDGSNTAKSAIVTTLVQYAVGAVVILLILGIVYYNLPDWLTSGVMSGIFGEGELASCPPGFINSLGACTGSLATKKMDRKVGTCPQGPGGFSRTNSGDGLGCVGSILGRGFGIAGACPPNYTNRGTYCGKPLDVYWDNPIKGKVAGSARINCLRAELTKIYGYDTYAFIENAIVKGMLNADTYKLTPAGEKYADSQPVFKRLITESLAAYYKHMREYIWAPYKAKSILCQDTAPMNVTPTCPYGTNMGLECNAKFLDPSDQDTPYTKSVGNKLQDPGVGKRKWEQKGLAYYPKCPTDTWASTVNICKLKDLPIASTTCPVGYVKGKLAEKYMCLEECNKTAEEKRLGTWTNAGLLCSASGKPNQEFSCPTGTKLDGARCREETSFEKIQAKFRVAVNKIIKK